MQIDRQQLIEWLSYDREQAHELFEKARAIKHESIGRKTFFRGLVEFSNICAKDCNYCGIRKSNKNSHRYNLTDEEILESAKYALDNDFASLALQSGELESPAFTNRVAGLVEKLMAMREDGFGITLSCGEQSEETYKLWREKGARRYLLRIESSTKDLYYQLHPNDAKHNFERRLECIHLLRKTGWQVGTGIMIGVPGQTVEHLADDLLFMQNLDIDMCGMGPYIEHTDTPLYSRRNELWSLEERSFMTIKMIACLRILMEDINIAATTALQTSDSQGRTKALSYGANIIMPNITPGAYRDEYALYQNKPKTSDSFSDYIDTLENEIRAAGDEPGYGVFGDSPRFGKRG
jgi:biotin synthase